MGANPCKRLWLAVLCQALEEYKSFIKIEAGVLEKPHTLDGFSEIRAGFKWVDTAGHDFKDVCRMAGVDPGYILARAHKISNSIKKSR